jgi:hypothetical protein
MSQHGQLTDGAIHQWRPEARIDELDKLQPGGAAAVEFHAVEAKLGFVEQVERCKRHLLVVRRTWKNRSQRFNHGKGSLAPSNLGNSILWAVEWESWSDSPASS